MNDLNVYKIAQIGGLLLVVVMFILGRIGTYSEGLFIFYGVMALVGVGIIYGARKLDEMSRDRELDEVSRNRKLDEASRDE